PAPDASGYGCAWPWRQLVAIGSGRAVFGGAEGVEDSLHRGGAGGDLLAGVPEVFGDYAPALRAIHHPRRQVSLLPWDGFITCLPKRAPRPPPRQRECRGWRRCPATPSAAVRSGWARRMWPPGLRPDHITTERVKPGSMSCRATRRSSIQRMGVRYECKPSLAITSTSRRSSITSNRTRTPRSRPWSLSLAPRKKRSSRTWTSSSLMHD